MISIILFILAIVVALLNPHNNLISLIENALYILAMFIYFVNLRFTEGILRKVKNEDIKMLAETQLKLFYSKRMKIMLVTFLVLIKLISAAFLLILTINKVSMPLVIVKSDLLQGQAMLLSILSIILETLIVIRCSKKIIKAKERVYIICP